ncbi:hypothetical protein [Delftia acidovorans]|uniref:hypothetical protein n=1 Tax=Delftia acidovorans TaxID=80866 RepID=UPI0028A6E69F|nr:hypothetical protein [Delftia acidovorans]
MSLQGAKARARREVRALLELVLLPGLAAVLPWRVCFRLFKRIARWPWLYREACEADWVQARAKGLAPDREVWLQERRLVHLIDHADLYLHCTRSDRWMARHLEVRGDWYEAGQPGFLFTFHWGAGMWGLRHARQAGLKIHALAAPAEGDHFKGHFVLKRYAEARQRSVEQALGRPPVLVPKGLRQIRPALERGEQLLTVLDVPQDGHAQAWEARLLDEPVRISRAMPDLATRHKALSVLYLTGFDMDSGRRFLHIQPLASRDDADALACEAFAVLDRIIRERPASWHFWGQWPRFRSATLD